MVLDSEKKAVIEIACFLAILIILVVLKNSTLDIFFIFTTFDYFLYVFTVKLFVALKSLWYFLFVLGPVFSDVMLDSAGSLSSES
jgi:hypothetical protein